MPTGYTSKLYDGEQSFEDFVLSCMDAFDARGRGYDGHESIAKSFAPKFMEI